MITDWDTDFSVFRKIMTLKGIFQGLRNGVEIIAVEVTSLTTLNLFVFSM